MAIKVYGGNHGIATANVIPDELEDALDIQSSEAKDFLQISTKTGDEDVRMVKSAHYAYGDNLNNTPRMTITPQDSQVLFDTGAGSGRDFSFRPEGVEHFRVTEGHTKITGAGGTTGYDPGAGAGHEATLFLENSTANSANRCSLVMNVDDSGSTNSVNIDMMYKDSTKLRIIAQDNVQTIVAEDSLVIQATDDTQRVVVSSSNLNVQDLATIHVKNSSGTAGSSYEFRKSNNNGDGGHTVVNDNDNLGTIKFTGSDGDSYQEAGRIEVNVDGTPGGCLGVSTSFSGGVGAGYSTGTGVATTTTGGTGSGATVNIVEVNGSGAITALSVNATGSGYDTGDTFTVNGGSSLATCTVISGTPGEIVLSTTAGSSAQIHGANGGPIVRLLLDDQGIPETRTDTASLFNFKRYNSASPTLYGEFRTNAGGFAVHSMAAGNSSVYSMLFNYVERFRFTNADGFHILNGYSVPSSSVANGVKLYSEDVNQDPGSGAADYAELKVRDELGNITTLSPHNFSVAERSDPMAWSHYGKNPFVGKEINVDMLAVIKAVEQLSGQSFIQERDLDPSECRDWDTEELARVGKSQEAIDEWELNSDEDKGKIPRPELYVAQPKPDWMN